MAQKGSQTHSLKKIELQKLKKLPRYDILFKDVYSYVEYALELIKEKLSKAEFDLFQWSEMRLEKDTFSEGLMADLLFTVPLKADPLRIPFFILFEHKSFYKTNIAIQVAGYAFEIIKAFSNEKKQGTMPPMIMIVFSHGKKGIKGRLTLQDLLPEKWKEWMKEDGGKGPFSTLTQDMPNCGVRVYNVHDPALHKKWKHLKTRIVLNLFKNRELLKSDDKAVLEKELIGLFQHLKGVENQDILLSSVQPYLFRGNRKCSLDFFNECLVKAFEKDENLIKVKGGKMGAYIPMLERGMLEGLQKGIEKGMEKGIEKGMEKGIEKGRQEGINSVILNMLKAGMSLSTIVECTGVSKEQVLKLQKQASNL